MEQIEDIILVALSDPCSSIEVKQIMPHNVNNIKKMIRKLRENRISLKTLNRVFPSIEVSLGNELNREELLLKEWIKTFIIVNSLFTKANVSHVFIKTLTCPNVIMNDIDVLPLNPIEELKALKLLADAEFEFYRIRILAHPLRAHPLKISARRKNGRVFVDFYPVPMWTRKRVHENIIIIERRRLINIYGVDAYVPSPEDDFYLIATHSFNDFKIPLAVILHALGLVKDDFDWDYLYNLALSYGTLDAVYVFLKVLEEYSRRFRNECLIDKNILLAYERHGVCRRIKEWFERTYAKKLTFPVRIPIRFGSLYSSFYHSFTLYGSMRFSEFIYDFLSHYYSPLALRLNELKNEGG